MSHFEWIHCNKCAAMGHRGGVFWFTSCGHIVCSNCMNQQGGPSPGRKAPCLVCQSVATIMEISRSMRPDLLALFKSPKDLLAEFTKRLKMTMDFQNGQRQSLMKKLHEKVTRENQCSSGAREMNEVSLGFPLTGELRKPLSCAATKLRHNQVAAQLFTKKCLDHCEKAHRYAKAAQAELLKRSEREKALLAERNQLKAELEKAREHAERMGKLLTQREQELHRIQKKSPCRRHSPYSKKKHGGTGGFSSLTGQTPITPLSFIGCTTSTPNVEMASFLARQQDGMNNDGGNLYSITGMFGFPTRDNPPPDDPSLAGGPQIPGQTTPSLLGMREEGDEGCTLRYF